MYDRIRGKGLTYGASMSASVTEGRLRVRLTRSSRLEAAFHAFREIVQEYAGEDAPWENVLLGTRRGCFF